MEDGCLPQTLSSSETQDLKKKKSLRIEKSKFIRCLKTVK